MKIANLVKSLVKWISILFILYHVTKLLLANIPRVHVNEPEGRMTTAEIIESRGYPLEVHHVVTEDGYILEMKRIPGANKCGLKGKKPVFLQHGMTSSDHVFLLNSNENALAYVLADRCFDVWLGNSRGTTYSRRHVTLNPEEEAYWDFAWDEMARYDIPANIDYILNATGEEKLVYVGHSLGCTLFYIAMIEHPHLNDKIELMFSLAPAASMANLSNNLRFMASAIEPIRLLLSWTGSLVYADCQSPTLTQFMNICGHFDICLMFGAHVFFDIFGHSTTFTQKTINSLGGHYPSGASFQVMMQFLQNYNSGWLVGFFFFFFFYTGKCTVIAILS